MSTRTSNLGPEYPNQNNESRIWAQMTLQSCTRKRLNYGVREINQEHRGHMYPFWSRGSVKGLPLKAICEPNELFHLTSTFKTHQKRTLTNTIMVNLNRILWESDLIECKPKEYFGYNFCKSFLQHFQVNCAYTGTLKYSLFNSTATRQTKHIETW